MTEKLKICMVGATGVGKTSLAQRFSRSIFTDRYRTTIGVAIERRDVKRGEHTTELVIWDLSGEDEFQNVQPAYFRGASGYVLVVDGTRPETIETALALKARLQATVGDLPFVAAINKSDLADTFELGRRDLQKLETQGWPIVHTSARTGDRVEEVFERLVDAIHDVREPPWT